MLRKKYQVIDSTQKKAIELAKGGFSGEAIIIAEAQTGGIGRRCSKWESPYGGLYISVIKNCPLEKRELASHMAAAAVLEALEKQGVTADYKWPNDIIINGNKAAGIILHSLDEYRFVAGVGLNANINKADFSHYLRDIIEVVEIDKNTFINDFLEKLSAYIDKRVSPLGKLNKRNFLKGKNIRSGSVEGNAEGIDSRGRIEINTGSEIKKVSFGRVVILKNVPEMDSRIICVDVGNSRTRVGLTLPEKRGFTVSDLSTKPHESLRERVDCAISDFKIGQRCDGAALSSVVESVEKSIYEVLKLRCDDTVCVNRKNRGNIKLKVQNAAEVGGDRICNAAAVCDYYGSGAVVIDLGTANTFDFINENYEFDGGVIAPGAGAMYDSLVSKADKLKSVKFSYPKSVIGKSTASALNSGLFYTLRGQIEKIIDKIRAEKKSFFRVIITGGGVNYLREDKEYLEQYIIDENLTLKGLLSVWKSRS